eukprot:214056_1
MASPHVQQGGNPNWLDFAQEVQELDLLRQKEESHVVRANLLLQMFQNSPNAKSINDNLYRELFEVLTKVFEHSTMEVELARSVSSHLSKLASSELTILESQGSDLFVFPDGYWSAERRILSPQSLVAAQTDGNFWILGSVVRFLGHERNFYEILDEDQGIDAAPQTHRKHYQLPPANIIPLPDRTVVRPEFRSGTTVFAIYPGTTVFYSALVRLTPSQTRAQNPNRNSDDYGLMFEDDGNSIQTVSARYVIPFQA